MFYNCDVFISLVPVPHMTIIAPSNQIVGQSLTLQSSITTVRGIISRVDIVWSGDDIPPETIMGATPNTTNDISEVYEYTYHIPLLSTSDDGRVIECEMIIMATPSIVSTNNVKLDVTGKCCKVLLVLYKVKSPQMYFQGDIPPALLKTSDNEYHSNIL